MFQTVPLSIIRSYSLYTQQWYVVPSWSCCCSKAVYKPVWHIPLLSVQWITPDDGQRNCLKHVDFYSKSKSEKSVHLVGFIIRKFVTMHGHMNAKLDRLLQYFDDALGAPYLTAAGVHKFWATKFCTVAPNICRTLLQFCPLTCKNADHCTWTEHRAPDNSEIQRS
jgi:hypothetical protein